jgi:hypothetical protein
MLNPIIEVFNHTLMITGFVFVMMLVIEYINVLTNGAWRQRLATARAGQYLFAALLGAIPGCLGAFIVVAMYSHRMLSLGAVVAAMIATSGDESFVMLALIPKEALLLTGILFIIGVAAGFVTDIFAGRSKTSPLPSLRRGEISGRESCEGFELHTFESCRCFPRGQILAQWKERSPFRTILAIVLALFIIAVLSGQIGPPGWNWVRVSILFVSGVALFIVATVPDHFLEEHLWNHVARKHAPRIFLWTFGALIFTHLLIEQLHLENMIRDNHWMMLAVASLVGIIPESGPHLIFVTLFAKGAVPFSILLASSIVQDGHGMLPLLAHSRRAFIMVKLINLLAGLIIGTVMLKVGV